MKSEKTVAMGIVFALIVLMLVIFVGTASAALPIDSVMGTVEQKTDTKLEIHTEWKSGDFGGQGWNHFESTLEVPFEFSDPEIVDVIWDEISVGDYVEVSGFHCWGEEQVCLANCLYIAKVKSSGDSLAEKVITDIYGDPALGGWGWGDPFEHDPPLLGNFVIKYDNKPDCPDCPPGCICEAEYTNIKIRKDGNVLDTFSLYPNQNYVYEGEEHRIDVTFFSGATQCCMGGQVPSNFVIHIEETPDTGLSKDIRITNDPADSINPRIAVDSNNNVHIIWNDDRVGNSEIYYTKLHNNGNTLIEDMRITYDTTYSAATDVAIDSKDNIHISWFNGTWRSYEVYYTKLDSNGNILIGGKKLGDGLLPSIVVDAENSVHVIWIDDRDMDYEKEMYYMKLDSDGNTLIHEKELPILTYGDPVTNLDSDGNIRLVRYVRQNWRIFVYYSKLDNKGNVLIDQRIYSLTSTVDVETLQDSLDIAIDSYNNIHITWRDDKIYDRHNEDYYSKLKDIENWVAIVIDGKRLPSDDTWWCPAITTDSRANVTIVWHYWIDENSEICYMKLDNNGNTLIDLTRLTYDPAQSISPDIAIDSNDKVHIIWQDNRDGNWEIYYRSISMETGIKELKDAIESLKDACIDKMEYDANTVGTTVGKAYSEIYKEEETTMGDRILSLAKISASALVPSPFGKFEKVGGQWVLEAGSAEKVVSEFIGGAAIDYFGGRVLRDALINTDEDVAKKLRYAVSSVDIGHLPLFESDVLNYVTIGNIDGDNKNEVIVGRSDGGLAIYSYNNTWGYFEKILSEDIWASINGVVAGNFVGDEDDEIAVFGNVNEEYYVLEIWKVIDGSLERIDRLHLDINHPSYIDIDIAIGDSNNNGRNEIIVGESYLIHIFELIDGDLLKIGEITTSTKVPSLGIGDIDNDQREEIVVKGKLNWLRCYKYTPTGYEKMCDTHTPGIITDIAIGDSDNDGTTEIVVGRADTWVVPYEYSEGILKEDYPFKPPGTQVPAGIASIEIGDIDHDTKNEIITGRSDGYVVPYKFCANFYKEMRKVDELGSAPAYLFLEDITGDGYKDVLVSSKVKAISYHYEPSADEYKDYYKDYIKEELPTALENYFVKEAKGNIKTNYEQFLSEIAGNELPEDYPLEEIIGYLERLKEDIEESENKEVFIEVLEPERKCYRYHPIGHLKPHETSVDYLIKLKEGGEYYS